MYLSVETGESFLRYFSRNNIELDILRIVFFANIHRIRPDFETLTKESLFDYIDKNLIQKLQKYHFLTSKDGCLCLSFRGSLAIASIIGEVNDLLRKFPKEDISDALSKKGILFGGSSEDRKRHKEIVEVLLGSLEECGVLERKDDCWQTGPEESVCELCSSLESLLIGTRSISTKSELQELICAFRKSLSLQSLSIGYLLKNFKNEELEQLKKVVGFVVPETEPALVSILRQEAERCIQERNWFTSASYWFLEARLHEDREERELAEQCQASGYSTLAIYCKRTGRLESASQFYERAYELMSKDPLKRRNALLQRANSYECMAKLAAKKDLYDEASEHSTKAAENVRTLSQDRI